MTVRYMTAAGDTVRTSRLTRQKCSNTTYSSSSSVADLRRLRRKFSTATPVLVLPQILPPFFTVCFNGYFWETPDRGESTSSIGSTDTAQPRQVTKTAALTKGQIHHRMNISQIINTIIVDPTAKPHFKGGQIRRGKERVHC
jgi:hypothetical protein